MVHKGSMVRMKDITQMDKKLMKPEIRVWVHPAKGGDDYWYAFKTLSGARKWSQGSRGSPEYAHVETPLIAFRGFEMSVNAFKKKYPKVKL